MHKSVSIKFKSLRQMSAKDKAEIASSITSAVASVEGMGLIDKATALRELKKSAEETGVWGSITDDIITEAENEPPPLPESTKSDIHTSVPKIVGKASGSSEPDSDDPGASGSE